MESDMGSEEANLFVRLGHALSTVRASLATIQY